MADKKEYIERGEAILAVTRDGCTANVVGVLFHMPAADVVEVVRYKDCKHRNPNGWKCLRDNLWHDMNDFCSYGERKEQT